MRLVIADDHQLMRRGVRDLVLASHPEWMIVGEASHGDEAVRLVSELQPDIAILDFAMPGRTGPEAALGFAAASPSTRSIILTMHDSEGTLCDVIRCGAFAYVLKGEADLQLAGALRAVAEGRRYFHPSAEEALRLGFLQSTESHHRSDRPASMTRREMEIVSLLAMGLSSKEAAARLNIGTRTVETHRLNIYRKLHLRSLADLVRLAIRNGLISAEV